jgi:hypothetical protein
MFAAALATSMTVAGLILFIIGLAGSTRPNPSYGFGLLIGGLGLVVTTIVAAKHERRG